MAKMTTAETGRQVCWRCQTDKPMSEFYNHKDRPNGKSSECAECCRARQRSIPKEKRAEYVLARKLSGMLPETARKSHLKKTYGISPEVYDEMLVKQNGVCAICGGIEIHKRKNLHVDHCHKTGQVRGLLCGNCNRMIGLAEDSAQRLTAAIAYLSGGVP